MADSETVEKVCAAQRDRVRLATHTVTLGELRRGDTSGGTSSGGIGRHRHRAWQRTGDSGDTVATFVPAEDPRLRRRSTRVRTRKAPSALQHLICCCLKPGASHYAGLLLAG